MLSGYEMSYFYQEQKQRLKFLNESLVYFEDFLCQMNDAFRKEENIVYTLEELLKKPELASVFFNFLTNLEKLISYEQKDLFRENSEKNEFPDYTEWDKFAMHEYRRLSSEDDDAENSDVLENNPLDERDGGGFQLD